MLVAKTAENTETWIGFVHEIEEKAIIFSITRQRIRAESQWPGTAPPIRLRGMAESY